MRLTKESRIITLILSICALSGCGGKGPGGGFGGDNGEALTMKTFVGAWQGDYSLREGFGESSNLVTHTSRISFWENETNEGIERRMRIALLSDDGSSPSASGLFAINDALYFAVQSSTLAPEFTEKDTIVMDYRLMDKTMNLSFTTFKGDKVMIRVAKSSDTPEMTDGSNIPGETSRVIGQWGCKSTTGDTWQLITDQNGFSLSVSAPNSQTSSAWGTFEKIEKDYAMMVINRSYPSQSTGMRFSMEVEGDESSSITRYASSVDGSLSTLETFSCKRTQ
jgi:hypothetical protein